ncbi:MAG: metallophosphoesterase [Oscillospiraceae bacterium]
MSLFVIGDLHLSLGVPKPMDIFAGWGNYTERLTDNWNAIVKRGDTVVIAGDVSWAMQLSEAVDDFNLIESLPGRKIIIKGNHDYWWMTRKKNDLWCAENSFSSISFMLNDSYMYETTALCGTRSWFYDEREPDNDRVFKRELGRLEASLKSAQNTEHDDTIVFLHYPPIFSSCKVDSIIELLLKYHVSQCYYGHIHGQSISNAFCGSCENIKFQLISADYLKFSPYKIK